MGEAEESVSGEFTRSYSRDGLRLQQEPEIHAPPLGTVAKKKRNLAGMPDPEADVIALSPETLLAKNRFVCEVCGKGFQRDQNLQLHRRGHNLPWKLKQRNGNNEVMRKRVYVCPEVNCVHHSPSRALGDLTGIKKHFCRKHGEKKWKCDRCSRRYAVLSDWKAHMKTCGTREYRCDCGTVFSRRDSFTTHRAFCDTLAEESVRANRTLIVNPVEKMRSPQPPPSVTPSETVLSPGLLVQSSEIPENTVRRSPQWQTVATSSTPPTAAVPSSTAAAATSTATATTTTTAAASVFASIFTSPATLPMETTSLCLSPPDQYLCAYPSTDSPLLPANQYNLVTTHQSQPAMSATALLQRAAQMGSTASNQSLLRGFGLTVSSPLTLSPSHEDDVKLGLTAGLGPGLDSGSPATLDLLGLGLNPTAASTGLSALLTSYDSGFSLRAAAVFAPATSYGGGSSTSQAGDGGFDDRRLKGPALL